MFPIHPVTVDDLLRALAVVNDAVERRDPGENAFAVGSMAIFGSFHDDPDPDKARAVCHRFTLAMDLAQRPMLKREWTRVNEGREEVCKSLLYAAATIPYTSHKISSREVHRIAKQYDERNQ